MMPVLWSTAILVLLLAGSPSGADSTPVGPRTFPSTPPGGRYPARMAADADRADALAERLRADTQGALELFAVYLGERLGLYRALAGGEPVTSTELAERTGVAERYAREWLEHQASNGLLEAQDATAEPLARRYRMPPEHVPVLADRDDLRYQAYRGVDIARTARALPDVAEAYRSGGATPPLSWEPEGRAESNRAVYLNLLGTEWLPSIPDVDRRLRADPPARIADVGCGIGWSGASPRHLSPLRLRGRLPGGREVRPIDPTYWRFYRLRI